MLLWVSLPLQNMSTIHSPLSSRHIVWFLLNTDCLLPFLHLNSTRWCRFTSLTHVVRKANVVKRKLNEPCDYIIHTINPYIWMMGVTVSLSASLLQKTNMATNSLCQIALNWQLWHKFENWRKFSSYIKAKLSKKKLHKTRAAYIP
jgi:hypothetical protein